MSDIFREVDEALQQEKLEKFWQKYHVAIITGIALLIGSTAAYTGWQSWSASRNIKQTSVLIEAQENTNIAPALQNVVENTSGGPKAIALMTLAADFAEKGNYVQAAQEYKNAYESNIPQSFRELARVMYVRSVLAQENDEQKDADQLLNTLEPVLDNEKSPWIWQARIEAASLAANQLRDYDRAVFFLAPFQDAAGLPQNVQENGMSLLRLYTLKAEKRALESVETENEDTQ